MIRMINTFESVRLEWLTKARSTEKDRNEKDSRKIVQLSRSGIGRDREIKILSKLRENLWGGGWERERESGSWEGDGETG